ncbi:MAG TPA: type II secretion system protein GspM [Myxococcales bacterium]|jgi:general secretion pathway protein M|nr:type II secretion system protein GspM [Myxococcales bacterium]
MEQQLKQLWSEVQAWYLRLTERERVLVAAAGGTLGAFIIFVILFSFSTSAAGYRDRTEKKLKALGQAEVLAASYADAERARQDVERQLSSSGVSLISYIEDKGEQAGLKIPAMNPKGEVPLGDGRILESSVELTLTDVSLRSLHQFLTTVEQGPGVVKVKFLRLEPRPDSQTLTAWATISTYRLKP